ncbi:MAG: hypothetical protein KAR17_09785 [Cyclobacteriaceae bacterium]|nr:hypothetical protein [Cyclobacteriaceae bacterium]
MNNKLVIILSFIIAITGIILYAYRGTWGKTDIEFRIHINEQLVQESAFGESPTFAIWFENPTTGDKQTVFVTRRAALGDWEGKAEIPVALPHWFEVYKIENETKDLPNFEKPASVAVTGATPKPGYFTTRARVDVGSKWICWIEVNLSGDYNEYYQEYNQVEKIEDEYGTGQPALLYKAKFEAIEGTVIIPEIAGISVADSPDGYLVQPLKGITTAVNIFDEISIVLVKPTPKILESNS